MVKRYLFEVLAEDQEAAEKKLNEEGTTKHCYLLTTEPVKDYRKILKEAQETAKAGYEKSLLSKDDVLIAYKEGYKDALEDLVKRLNL